MSDIIQGIGIPLLKFNNTVYKLPNPTGPDRNALRIYDFNEIKRGEYWSEGRQLITVGKKWQFVGNLYMSPANKVTLEILQLAALQPSCEFTLNDDKEAIKFNVVVKAPKERFFEGLTYLYSISVQMVGSELLDAPAYRDLEIAGYGLDYGNTQAGQSP